MNNISPDAACACAVYCRNFGSHRAARASLVDTGMWNDLVSGSFEEIGDGGKVTKVWRLSGRRQWDSILYSKEEKENVVEDKQIN